MEWKSKTYRGVLAICLLSMFLTLSWRSPYQKETSPLIWFLCDTDLPQERVKDHCRHFWNLVSILYWQLCSTITAFNKLPNRKLPNRKLAKQYPTRSTFICIVTRSSRGCFCENFTKYFITAIRQNTFGRLQLYFLLNDHVQRRSGIFIFNFEHISPIVLVFLLLNLSR